MGPLLRSEDAEGPALPEIPGWQNTKLPFLRNPANHESSPTLAPPILECCASNVHPSESDSADISGNSELDRAFLDSPDVDNERQLWWLDPNRQQIRSPQEFSDAHFRQLPDLNQPIQCQVGSSGAWLNVQMETDAGDQLGIVLQQSSIANQLFESSHNTTTDSTTIQNDGNPDFELPFGSTIPYLVEDDQRLVGDVVNLSTVCLSPDQLKVLNGTVKFRQAPRKVPYLELVAGAECAACSLELNGTSSCSGFRTACALAIPCFQTKSELICLN